MACIKAGAAIIHAHTLEPDSGKQNGDVDNCAAFMNGIREQVDAIVYPTVVGPPSTSNPAWLWDATVELAKRGILEWGVLDPGSVNFCFIDSDGARLMGGPGVYMNSNPALETAAGYAAEYKFHPAYACYEPGFVRQGALLHRHHPTMPVPVYRFMFSTGMTFSFPPEPWAVEAYAKLLEKTAPGSPWMIAGLAVDVLPLIPTVVGSAEACGSAWRTRSTEPSAPMSNWSTPRSQRSRRPAASPLRPPKSRAELAAYKRPAA